MKKYDYLIVGSGLFGSVFAYEATRRGRTCLLIDKRSHAGGNVFCENIEGINVHKYGAHIFHTNDRHIWEFVNSFVVFNRYTNSPIAEYKGIRYNLPFNMNTFYQLWGVKTPQQAKDKLKEEIGEVASATPRNLEEQALSLVGRDIYEKLIKGYTEKQWGRLATELPAFIIKRIPLRFTYDNNYFNDKYQGIPIGGYNKLVDGLLKGSEIRLDSDYFSNRSYWDTLAEHTIFTGHIDQFYNYRYGKLDYRSLRFEHKILDTDNHQGNAVINYTDGNVPYTRTIEHKHFEFGTQIKTVITKEFPDDWTPEKEAYYPINDHSNTLKYEQYKALSQKEDRVLFGGRLATYQYYDMHQIIASALKMAKVHFGDKSTIKQS